MCLFHFDIYTYLSSAKVEKVLLEFVQPVAEVGGYYNSKNI